MIDNAPYERVITRNLQGQFWLKIQNYEGVSIRNYEISGVYQHWACYTQSNNKDKD